MCVCVCVWIDFPVNTGASQEVQLQKGADHKWQNNSSILMYCLGRLLSSLSAFNVKPTTSDGSTASCCWLRDGNYVPDWFFSVWGVLSARVIYACRCSWRRVVHISLWLLSDLHIDYSESPTMSSQLPKVLDRKPTRWQISQLPLQSHSKKARL